MAYDDKTLVRDGSGLSPAPQYFNPDEDAYEPLFGRNNAARAELYDENGDPINITGLLDGVSTALNTLAGTIEDIVGDAVASPDSNTVLARLKSLEDNLGNIITGNTVIVSRVYGDVVDEQRTESDAVSDVITFSDDIFSIEIYHEEATWQDFIVNGISLKVPRGGYRTLVGGTAGKLVTIPPGISCLVSRLI